MYEELKVQETTIQDYGSGTNVQLCFDVDDGPIRDILFRVLRMRGVMVAPTSDGKGIVIYSKIDRVEE